MPLDHRTITGMFTARTPDSGDSDLHPDRVALWGRALLTPEYRVPLVQGGEHIVVRPIDAVIEDGQLLAEVRDGGEVITQALSLPVTVDDAANQGWSWRLEFQQMRVGQFGDSDITLPSRRFPVEPGEEPLDLASVAGTWSGGRLITRGEKGDSITSVTAEDGQIVITWDGGDDVVFPFDGGLADRVVTAEDLIAQHASRLTTVEQQAEDTAEIVERIKRTNVSAGEGAPTGTAPVGWIHIDVATGDTYRMEA